MKKLLLFTVFFVFSALNSMVETPPFRPVNGTEIGDLGSAAAISKDFHEKEKQHKIQWLKYNQKSNQEKFDLMIGHYTEWFNYGINNIGQNAQVSSQEEAEKAIFDQFVKAHSIVEKHMEQWKDLCNKQHQEGMSIYNAQKASHDSFAKYIK